MFGGGETLEDSLLTTNVPGRYSKWDKGDDDGNHRSDDDECHSDGNDKCCRQEENDEPDGYCPDDEEHAVFKAIDDQRKAKEERVPEGIREAIKRGERPGHKTGAKGVLADYKAFKVAEYETLQHEKRQREAILKRIAEGGTLGAPVTAAPPCINQGTINDNKNGQDDDEDEEDSDDEFLRSFRAQRLLEMQAAAHMPVFGEIKEATAFEFVDAVNQADPRVKVVVHIYEPYLKACGTLNKYLETLARKYPHVKFLRLLASAHPKKDLDEVALPMLVIYHKGEVVECIARVHEEFGDTFVLEDVEWLLEKKGALATPSAQSASGSGRG